MKETIAEDRRERVSREGHWNMGKLEPESEEVQSQQGEEVLCLIGICHVL